jgi:hypothetical protein
MNREADRQDEGQAFCRNRNKTGGSWATKTFYRHENPREGGVDSGTDINDIDRGKFIVYNLVTEVLP